jgi:TetR/AcrR family fatty acid metabolism transcriptional regulator
MKEAIAEGRRSVEAIGDPVGRLREIARLHLDRMGRNRALAVVFQVELRQSTKFMERFSATHLREYLGIIRDVVAEGQAAGVFRREVSATIAAKLFFGMLDEMATNWILSRRKYSLASQAELIVDLFVGGLKNGVLKPSNLKPKT